MKLMQRSLLPLMVVGLSLGWNADASAQNRARRTGPPTLQRNQRPNVSPYLNLAAIGGDSDAAGFAYYQLVKPQVTAIRSRERTQREITEIDREIEANRQELMQNLNSKIGTTGHKTSFMNRGNYFPK